jgi:putative transcriptional regulator
VDDDPLAPALLVAMPQLLDPNFKRSVVLLVHHDGDGTFGLVLTRESEIEVDDLCSSLGIEWQGSDALRVSWGGPVQPNTGWVLFGDAGEPDESEDTTEVADGVHFAGSLATLRRVAETPPERLRLFLGYAGWGPGQLESELAQGAWLVAPVSTELVFGVRPDHLWVQVLRELGVDPTTLVSTPGIH